MKIPEKPQHVLLERTLLGGSNEVNAAKENNTSKNQTQSVSSADQVNISEKARTLQKLTQLATTGVDVRTERVAELQKEIEAGTYQSDPKQVAEKLVRSTLMDHIL